MSKQQKPMDFFEGLAHLFRFDTMSANWRNIIRSFDPVTAGILLAAAPVIAPIIAQQLKELGVITEPKEAETIIKTSLETAGTATMLIPA